MLARISVFLLLCFVMIPGRVQADTKQPNILFLLTDQWRAQSLGYAGNEQVQTPNIDALARQSVNFQNAVSGCPVCCPFRGSLMTGQRPLTHGVFLNDVQLPSKAVTIAEVLDDAGYETGFIGKWHLDGRGRSAFTPPERRQGFEFWRALECTHNYNRSFYYGDSPQRQTWEGYDAFAQTRVARQFIRDQSKKGQPFLLVMSYGSPHNPYHTAPPEYQRMYDPERIKLRPNVPQDQRAAAQKELAGYFAHCTALDDCVSDLLATLKETGIDENTIVVLTSDHGDMLHSHGQIRKQKPWDESLRVPMLFRLNGTEHAKGRTVDTPINSEDLMPTLLGLCKVSIPETVEGLDYSGYLRGGKNPSDGATVITCPSPFGEWQRSRGGKEYRGLRTTRYTYVRDLNGPWLLYDNQADPYQLHNLCNDPAAAPIQAKLDALLNKKLAAQNDEFLHGSKYIAKFGYQVNPKTGTVPYTN
ncbi:Arylsulfatase [Gimesia panareensis]|uniref:Arylsulfatase n=1 Tax=Gimesia panareensis TaxID=2527978 RepID=A0A518FZ42_9PLAN|nr:sulfatase [Gimesia panareensis]QDV21639.1 Arylsulfatase [Gimesia panareensis]